MTDARLVHLGNVLVDMVLYVPNLPAPGGDVLASDSRIIAGGGLNVMVSARRQGLPTAYGGMHGTGPFAELARAGLTEAGVELLQPPYPDEDTGFTLALVDDTGERTFATSPGAEARLSADRLAGLRPRPADVIYLSGYGLAYPVNGPALAAWLSTVDPSVTVVVDPGPLVTTIPAPVLTAVLARADWLSCNEREALAMTETSDPDNAIRMLTGRAGVVVRTGPRGCLLAAADGPVWTVPGFPVTAVDTNGAGDAHVGAFIAGLVGGLSALDAARRANAAAAIAVSRRGPTTAPTAAEVDAFLARSAG